MKVLVTGANGQLGRELVASKIVSWDIIALSHSELDIADEIAVENAIKSHHPDILINAAGYTNVDQAESEPEIAFRHNASGPANLAKAIKAYGGYMVHVSTDYVFDGSSSGAYGPDSSVNPLSVYGLTKLEGERAVRLHLPERSLVIRTSWVYSVHGRNFVKTMLEFMQQREEIRVVTDQIGSPTWARTLVGTIWSLLQQSGLHGVYHWTDSGVASWYDFALAIAEEGRTAGLLKKIPEIFPIPTSDYPTPARRPANSILDKTATWAVLGIPGNHWRQCLRSMLQELVQQ